MLKQECIDTITDDSWDKFIEKHPLGQCYHTTSWKRVVEKSFKHINCLILTLCDPNSNAVKAGIPIYIVNSKILGNRIVCVPFGTLCDPLISTKMELDELTKNIFKLKKDNNCKRVEIKLFQSGKYLSKEKYIISTTHKHHYLYLEKPFYEIKSRFKRQVNQAIRKATKEGLEVIDTDSNDHIKNFYDLYLKTRKRNYVPAQPLRYFQNLVSEFGRKKQLSVLVVKKGNKIIAGGIILKFKNRSTLEFLASDAAYLKFRPNHILAYRAIKNAYEEGYKVFDFGRTVPSDNGLMRFKKYWGTSIVDLKMAVNKEAMKISYDHRNIKYKVISNLAGNLPMPAYRILNNFCYRHLG